MGQSLSPAKGGSTWSLKLKPAAIKNEYVSRMCLRIYRVVAIGSGIANVGSESYLQTTYKYS